MASRDPLPDGFAGRPFTVGDAIAAGASRRRLRGSDLASPFHAVRAPAGSTGLVGLCRAYLTRMRPGNVFSHETAARLWGVPMPGPLDETPLHVSCPHPRRAPSGRGIVGHRWSFHTSCASLDGLPVSAPAETWIQLSATWSWTDLVVAAEYMITGRPFEDVLPLLTLEELHYAHRRSAGTRGAVARARALAFARVGPFSRPESQVGILFALAGLPRPLLNVPVNDERGSFLALPDAVWEQFRVAFEYEGDHHRDQDQFRRDIQRVERLVDHGWIVVKASARDLYGQPQQLVARVASRLTSRGWTGKPRELRRFVGFEP